MSALLAAAAMFAAEPSTEEPQPDSDSEPQPAQPQLPEGNVAVPERALVITGGQNGISEGVYTVLYDTSENTKFDDPVPPRFLLIDRKGRTAFGIGGYVEGVIGYDFMGAIDNDGFNVNQIKVPADPAERNQLHASVNHTNIFMKLITHTKFGVLSAYAQADFSGDGRNFCLKHACVQLDNFLGGLTRSTFQDALSVTPTIDYTGPAGDIESRNIQLRYTLNMTPHLSFAIAAEAPQYSFTTNSSCETIKQRVPDIPAYIQYRWADGKSHVRLSALLRTLSYRNTLQNKNHFVTGWAAKLSGAIKATDLLTIHYGAAYGQGYAQYVNDTTDQGFDLIYDTDGRMIAPHQFALTTGLRLNISKKIFMTGTYSINRMYNQSHLGPDTYRRASYASANIFYTPTEDFLCGIEYLNGQRFNVNGDHASANRIQAMIRYNF